MRGRSSKQETKEAMEIDELSKLKEEPHLSGAYIRSLVKQLTSSRTKEPMNPQDHSSADTDGFSGQNMANFSEGLSENLQNQQPQLPQQHKKQVRRRLHTSRPYQERLLNMAEARREIVTALKFHRAAMKQANEQQQQQQEQKNQQEREQQQQQQQSSLPVQLSTPPCFEQEGKLKTRRNPRIYPSNTTHFSHYLDNFSYTPFTPPPCPPPYPFSWPTSSILAPTTAENLNFPLPNQTLGLNLNFHDFIDTPLYHSSDNPPSVYSSSSPSSSPFPSPSIATEGVPSIANEREGVPPAAFDETDSYAGAGLHQVMDDDEMAEIRSIGEQHQMEWNDTMNLVTSAWWFKFMRTMELDPEVKTEDDCYHPFEQVMEFPAWLNANDGCLQQHFNDHCSQDYFHDPALPRMDIGEIEGIDGEWLA